MILTKDLKIVTYMYPIEQKVVDAHFKALVKSDDGYIFVDKFGYKLEDN